MKIAMMYWGCLLYTSDAADERSSVDLGGRRIIKKKKEVDVGDTCKNTHIREEKARKTTKGRVTKIYRH